MFEHNFWKAKEWLKTKSMPIEWYKQLDFYKVEKYKFQLWLFKKKMVYNIMRVPLTQELAKIVRE